jgi:hypothetical protein
MQQHKLHFMGRVCGGLLVQSRTSLTNPEHNDNTNTNFLYRRLARHVDSKVLAHLQSNKRKVQIMRRRKPYSDVDVHMTHE